MGGGRRRGGRGLRGRLMMRIGRGIEMGRDGLGMIDSGRKEEVIGEKGRERATEMKDRIEGGGVGGIGVLHRVVVDSF